MLKCFLWATEASSTSAACPIRGTKCQPQWLWSGTLKSGQCHLSWLMICLIFQNTKSLDLIYLQWRKKWKLWKRTTCLFKRQNDDINRKITVSGRAYILGSSCSAFDHWERLALMALLQLRIIVRMGSPLHRVCGSTSLLPTHCKGFGVGRRKRFRRRTVKLQQLPSHLWETSYTFVGATLLRNWRAVCGPSIHSH